MLLGNANDKAVAKAVLEALTLLTALPRMPGDYKLDQVLRQVSDCITACEKLRGKSTVEAEAESFSQLMTSLGNLSARMSAAMLGAIKGSVRAMPLTIDGFSRRVTEAFPSFAKYSPDAKSLINGLQQVQGVVQQLQQTVIEFEKPMRLKAEDVQAQHGAALAAASLNDEVLWTSGFKAVVEQGLQEFGSNLEELVATEEMEIEDLLKSSRPFECLVGIGLTTPC